LYIVKVAVALKQHPTSERKIVKSIEINRYGYHHDMGKVWVYKYYPEGKCYSYFNAGSYGFARTINFKEKSNG